jgi:hypothetical protein
VGLDEGPPELDDGLGSSVGWTLGDSVGEVVGSSDGASLAPVEPSGLPEAPATDALGEFAPGLAVPPLQAATMIATSTATIGDPPRDLHPERLPNGISLGPRARITAAA